MNGFLIPCIAALCACTGFSLLFQLRGRDILMAAFCGAFSWAVYLIAQRIFGSDIIPYFFAGAAASLYSEVAAIVFRTPVTVYLIPGIIPTVPGLTIYRAMEVCLLNDAVGFVEKCIETFKIGGAITMGLVLLSAVFRLARAIINTKKDGISYEKGNKKL